MAYRWRKEVAGGDSMSRHNLTALVQAASKQGFTVHLNFDNGRPVFAVGCAEYGGDREFSTHPEAMAWVQAKAAK
jgi:hypothetical protein